MKQINFEELLVRTLAAADPKASATDRARFRVAWANYEAALPGQGDQPFLDAAENLGFPNKLPVSSTTLHHVKLALSVAKEKCKLKKSSGGDGGGQRERGEDFLR